MPGSIERISTLVKTKISSLLDRAENPAETLDYAPPQDDVDRQLEQIGARQTDDDEFARLKAELGTTATQQ